MLKNWFFVGAVALAACSSGIVAPQSSTPLLSSSATDGPFRYTVRNRGKSSGIIDAIQRGNIVEQVRVDEILVYCDNRSTAEQVAASVQGTISTEHRIPEQISSPSRTSGPLAKASPAQIPVAFSIRLPESPQTSSKTMIELAKREGLTGEVAFDSERSVAVMQAVLTIKQNFNGRIQGVGWIGPLAAQTATTEFRNMTAPNDFMFWWVGPAEPSVPLMGCGISAANGPDVWSTATGKGIRIAVIDSGFMPKFTHEPAITNIIPDCWDTVYERSDISGPGYAAGASWHGRAVSSLIFAPHDDKKGTLGIAPNAKPLLVSAKVDTKYYGLGIMTAIKWNADIISMSMTKNSAFPTYDAMYAPMIEAYKKGIIQVASAGNRGDQSEIPAAYWEVMSVSAHDKYGNRSIMPDGQKANSQDVDIWAPGSDIAIADDPGNDATGATLATGTSFSAPIVSGTIGLLLEKGRIVHKMEAARDYLRNRGRPLQISPGVIVKGLDVLNSVAPQLSPKPEQ